MLEKWSQKLAQRRIAAELRKNPLVAAGRQAISALWTDYALYRQQHSKEFLEKIALQLMERVLKVATANDPLAANREELVGMTIACANYQVLVLDPAPIEDPTGVRGKLGITGQLRPYIVKIAQTERWLAEDLHGMPEGPNGEHAPYQVSLIRYRQCSAGMLVHQQMRGPLNDYNQNASKDWFRPLFLCQCAVSEWRFRNSLGLPTDLDPMDGLEYASLANFVIDGERWPDLAWEQHYGKPLPRLN